MTKQEAIDLIKARLGSREDSDLDALVAAELALSQSSLEASPPYYWFCEKEDVNRQVTALVPTIAVPSGFIIEIEERVLEVSADNITFVPLTKMTLDDLRAKYAGAAAGQPFNYAMKNNKIYFGPTPDIEYYIRQDYHGRDTAITALGAGATNLWLTEAGDLLTAHAGLAVATWIKDSNASSAFGAMLQIAKQRVDTLHTAREEVNQSRMMEA